MYVQNSILVRKDLVKDEADPAFAYNRVRVIGPSTVTWATIDGDWTATGGNQGINIEPLTEFAGVLDEPYGKLRSLYDVEYEPEVVTEIVQTIRKYDANSIGPTPEEVFAAEAPGDPATKKAPRERTPLKAKSPTKPRTPLA